MSDDTTSREQALDEAFLRWWRDLPKPSTVDWIPTAWLAGADWQAKQERAALKACVDALDECRYWNNFAGDSTRRKADAALAQARAVLGQESGQDG